MKNYITIACAEVHKLQISGLVNAKFLYPKLIIFEDQQTIHIIDVEEKQEDFNNVKLTFKLDYDILDSILQDHLLWITLESGEVQVIDIYEGSQLWIKSNNFDNHKIIRFEILDGNVILISESGEYLRVPYSTRELVEEFRKGATESVVVLDKLRQHRSNLNDMQYKHLNGLYVKVAKGQILLKCPVTDLYEGLTTHVQIDAIVPWGDIVVLADKTNMWLMDLTNSTILFEFKNNGLQFYPLEAHNNHFYYLLWKEAELHICYAWNSFAVTEEDQDISTGKLSSKISSQDALKTKVQNLVDIALSSSNPSEVITELTKYIEKIEDHVFLIENALKLCQHDIYYKSILYPLHKQIFASGDSENIGLLTDLMIKVDLLEYIHFRGNRSYENVNVFEKTLKQLCIIFISKSDLDLASICWLKYSGTKLKILSADVLDILNVIPQNIKMSGLVIWLRNFVPSLLDENPYFIDIFVKWTVQRVFQLEQSSYWPKIGLKFIDEIDMVLEKSVKTISVRPISMDDLDTLKNHIMYIMELKEKFKINVLLGEISSQSPGEVALIMLRRCYTEDLAEFIQDYLPSFATRHIFELDDTLRSYIENEAATCGGGIDSTRLKVLLNAFRSPTSKLDCLLQVLKVLDVPWDSTILELAITAASLVFKDFTITDADRMLAQEIQKELNYAKVKVVLKKYNFPLTCTDYTIVLHKLTDAATVELNDLKIVTSVMTAYTNYGNVLYIDRCLKDCETRTALDFFHNLPHQEKRILLKTVMMKFEQIIIGNTNDSTLERNYVDFLKGTQFLNKIEINDLECIYHLKNSYNILLSLNCMYKEQYCANLATDCISHEMTASSGLGHYITQLTCARLLPLPKLMSLLHRVSTSNQIRKFVEDILRSLSSEEFSSFDNFSSALNSFKDGHNSKLLLDSFDVLIELVINCFEEDLHFLLKYIMLLNALINVNITVKNLSVVWKFHYIYLPMSSVTATNNLIHLHMYGFNMPAANDIDNIFRNTVNTNDFTIFRILATLLGYFTFEMQLFNKYYEVKVNATKKLITKVIATQEFDEVLLTSLLLIISNSKEHDELEDKMWIIETLQGQNESIPHGIMNYLSSLLIRRTFDLDNILAGNTISHPPQYVLKTKFNINLADISLPESTEETWDVKVILFYVLRQYPDITIERLFDLCQTLNVSLNDGLSLQLISLLITWELKYKVYNDELNCRKLYVMNNDKYLKTQCSSIWESIEDKGFLRDILQDFWKNGEVTLHGRLISINPYYYEIYMCIYNLIFGSSVDSKHKKEYFLLNFLKEYERKNAPKQYEFELFSVKGMFPEIGYYRLPFHLFMREDMWHNLKSEITLETYERWLPAISLLSLDADLQTAKDMICSNALKQTMTSRKRNETDENCKEKEQWRLTSREEPLLRAAHRCVRHIANMEWAGACLFYVLQGCAHGADQVAAAHLCYQFAQRWAALQPGNRAVRQMERLHTTLSTQHALHKIEWALEEFIRLSSEPSQLVRAMYLHPNFVEKMNRHDVNRAASEIADKNGINISSIRIQILENILSKPNERNENENCQGLHSKKLMTAKFILRATCPKMGAIYLSRIAFDDDSDFDKCKKLRALQCLMSVVEPDTAVKVSNRAREALWPCLLELLFIVNLENIDMPWVVATFMQDKLRALEQLLQTTGTNIDGLKIAADLARRFGNAEVIYSLIPLLLRVGLHEEIVPLLLKISCPPDDIIYTAWRSIILTPFQRADYPITERQKSKCLNAINLLPVCPIIKDEDLIEIWKNCVRCKCFGLGCLVLPYITPEKRQTLTELHKIDRRNLIASLKNLHAETYLVSGAMYVIESLTSKIYR